MPAGYDRCWGGHLRDTTGSKEHLNGCGTLSAIACLRAARAQDGLGAILPAEQSIH